MKWNGQALDLIHQNLSLPINLDNAKESIIVDLPNEIWSLILKFLPLQDVLSLKFLSKRFYRISFFDKKIKYFNTISHNTFEVDDYHDTFLNMLTDLLNKFKMNFDELTFLFLKYSFEDLKNLFMISNCFYHLFSCPRSVFARSNCIFCSRLYVLPDIRPKNFKLIDNFDFEISDDRRNSLSENSISILKRFKIITFFNSLEEFSTINSNQKRCLNTFIVQDYFHLVLVFFEVQLRILSNFFYNIVKDKYIKSKIKQIFFLEQCFNFSIEFVTYCISKVKIDFFEEIFKEFDFSDSDSNIIKVINKKYIEYCDRKYAS